MSVPVIPPRMARVSLAAVIVLALAAPLGCAHRRDLEGPEESAAPDARYGGSVQVGYASWYGGRLAGHRTADGERFDPNQMTAAHRTLPFGTWVEVRLVETGAAVRVRITDRGPFGHEERIIDLSREAARRLGMLRAGVGRVEIRVVGGP
ncbi:MAG: septal ring lytic transglycosylase RlpA family protein [Myxococcales bacterium]|nr:septal ring lytic transglycosylase RlpA family protein [Myxococcales bacterium]